MPAINERSTVPHRSLRLRWWRLLACGLAVLWFGPALGANTFPLIVALALAWVLWRSDRDSGRH